jgi:hypothetical protein
MKKVITKIILLLGASGSHLEANIRIEIWSQPGQIIWETLSQENPSQSWRSGSSGKAPALQVWSPEFKAHYCQKNRERKKSIRKKSITHKKGLVEWLKVGVGPKFKLQYWKNNNSLIN